MLIISTTEMTKDSRNDYTYKNLEESHNINGPGIFIMHIWQLEDELTKRVDFYLSRRH